MNPEKQEELPAFPKPKWMLYFLLLWIGCGLLPLVLVLVGTYWFHVADSSSAAVAGTIGDAFGLANSFFAAAALLFVVWSIRLQQQEIRFARDEWKDNTKSQKEQVEMMRQASALTAINHIYNHYSEEYGEGDATGIMDAIAEGHRKWAIRASFSSIDRVFESERRIEVERKMSQLAELLMGPDDSKIFLREVAIRVSDLLVDSRVEPKFRESLWGIYSILRSEPMDLMYSDSPSSRALLDRAAAVVQAWEEFRRTPEMEGSS